ncbi:MAG: hypothetical protein NT167_15315, partial [Verrucomicrobia bacterium]|nr:hypothetical protein [Verrucomicrobiota bacterium]
QRQCPLAMSLRERELLSTVWAYSLNGEYFRALPMVLPLPEGEGQGRLLLNSHSKRLRSHTALVRYGHIRSCLSSEKPQCFAKAKQ